MWNNIKTKGFTLLEVLVAVFVLTIGVLGAFTVVQNITFYSQMISSKLTATYLVQEGIELVRNRRDSNWLARVPWDQGLTGCAGGCQFGTVSPKFSRTIFIDFLLNKMTVRVVVSWEERGRSHSVTAQTELYNWR